MGLSGTGAPAYARNTVLYIIVRRLQYLVSTLSCKPYLWIPKFLILSQNALFGARRRDRGVNPRPADPTCYNSAAGGWDSKVSCPGESILVSHGLLNT